MNEYREAMARVAREDRGALRTWPGLCEPPCGVVIRGRTAYEYRDKAAIEFFGLVGVVTFRGRVGEELHLEVGDVAMCGRVQEVRARSVVYTIARGAPRCCGRPFCGHPEGEHWAELPAAIEGRPSLDFAKAAAFPVAICASCSPEVRDHQFKPTATRCHAPGCSGSYTPAGVCSACDAPRGAA